MKNMPHLKTLPVAAIAITIATKKQKVNQKNNIQIKTHMKPRARFLTGFAAAALTFGILMATLGPQRFGGHCGHHRGHYHGYCAGPVDTGEQTK
jgi:hypothetical protein